MARRQAQGRSDGLEARQVARREGSDGRAARWLGRGRAQGAVSAFEGDRDEPPGRDAREGVLARLRGADEQRQLLLLAARGDFRVTAEDQGRGAVVPGELFVRDRELVVRTAVT